MKPINIQEQSLKTILERYYQTAHRNVGEGCNHEQYILVKDIPSIISDIMKASHPAPDQPDGETQEELWQEVIEHFHAINDPTMINIPNEALKEFSIQRRKPNTK